MKINTICILSLILVSIFGCTPNNMIVKDCPDLNSIKADQGKAKIVISRSGQTGAAVDLQNYLNKKFIGTTAGYGYIQTEVTPGQHYIITKFKNYTIQKFNFEPDKVYFFKSSFIITNSFSDARAKQIFINKDDLINNLSNQCYYYNLDSNLVYENLDNNIYNELKYNFDKWHDDNTDLLYDNLITKVKINKSTETLKYKKTVTNENIYTETKLSDKYRNIVIKKISIKDNYLDNASEEDKKIIALNIDEFKNTLRNSTVQYLNDKRLFENIEPYITETKGTLVIDGEFAKFNTGSDAAKFFFGFALGDGQQYITVNMRLIDAETGEVLAVFTDREAGAMGTISYATPNEMVYEYQAKSLGKIIGAFIEKIY